MPVAVMRGLGIFALAILLLAAGWGWLDRVWAVAAPASGGPFLRIVEGCRPPLPSEGAAMMFAGFYEGPGASTVRLVSTGLQEDAVSVVDVRIAPGFAPIYLLMTSSTPTIVRLSGWTRRLERVVLVADQQVPMGVVGVPAELVSFAARHDCRLLAEHLYRPAQYESPLSLAGIVRRPRRPEDSRRLAYRMPDAVGGAYEPRLVTVSGSSVGAPDYDGNYPPPASDPLEDLDRRFTPAGVIEIDPGQLISNARAERYRVLPGWPGLAQLLREGKIRRHGSDRYEVLAQIELPAELSGALQVTFEVRPGVPWPRGHPGHSRVIRAGGF